MFFTIINLLLLNCCLLYLHKKKIINLNLLVIFSLHFISVIIINRYIVNPGFFPDQYIYLTFIESIRSFDFSIMKNFYLELSDRTFFSSLLLSLFPLPFVYDIVDVGLISKAIFVFSTIFLYKKRYLTKFSASFLLICPSLGLYTSLALKESLVIFGTIFPFILFVKKKYLTFVFFFYLMFFIKPHYLVLIFIFTLFFFIFNFLFKKNKILFYIFLIFLLFFLFIIIINYSNYFFTLINETRTDHWNNDILYGDPEYLNANNFFEQVIISSIAKFFFYPLPHQADDFFNFIQSIENILILFFIIFNFLYTYRAKNSLVILLFLFVCCFGIGSLVFNIGTITRWKMEVVTIYIVLSNFLLKCDKKV